MKFAFLKNLIPKLVFTEFAWRENGSYGEGDFQENLQIKTEEQGWNHPVWQRPRYLYWSQNISMSLQERVPAQVSLIFWVFGGKIQTCAYSYRFSQIRDVSGSWVYLTRTRPGDLFREVEVSICSNSDRPCVIDKDSPHGKGTTVS